jgi:hypothetical protein
VYLADIQNVQCAVTSGKLLRGERCLSVSRLGPDEAEERLSGSLGSTWREVLLSCCLDEPGRGSLKCSDLKLPALPVVLA